MTGAVQPVPTKNSEPAAGVDAAAQTSSAGFGNAWLPELSVLDGFC